MNGLKKRVLIIGSGGREHAIGWKLFSSALVGGLFFAPGNAGTGTIGQNVPIDGTDVAGLLAFAQKNAIDLTVVGPEASLAAGVVDAFTLQGLPIFGPTRRAAKLETRKAWATSFMERHGIPHPKSWVFTDVSSALSFLESLPSDAIWPVIKADGLAAGKGVILPASREEAVNAIKGMMVDRVFGEAGATIVMQERLVGHEVSVLAFSDGKTVIPMIPAQDYKRVGDGDRGLNTGGMGAIAPYPPEAVSLMDEITQTILVPTIKGMSKESNHYVGVLYAGLMLTADGPKVLEYNARFGDPETQVILPLLSSDVYEILSACVTGTLTKELVSFASGSAACVVLTAAGYPGEYKKGTPIAGLQKEERKGISVFHAGTRLQGNDVVTNGGRVFGVTAVGETLAEARQNVYSAIGDDGIHFDQMHYRTDIGKQNHAPKATRIEVVSTVPDMRAGVFEHRIKELQIGKLEGVTLVDVYTIPTVFADDDKRRVCSLFANPVVQKATVVTDSDYRVSETADFSWAIEIGFLPGVTDNIGTTASELISDACPGQHNVPVYTSQLVLLRGEFLESEIQKIALSLYNPLIQRAVIKSSTRFLNENGMGVVVPKVLIETQPGVSFVTLHLSDTELEILGKSGIPNADGTRRGPLSLAINYLFAIRTYFDAKKRNPTDIELETLAQTWSEHCKHTIFADPIDDIPDGLYRHYIQKATETVRQLRGADDICVSVFSDNSGAILFDDEYLITDKVETHNSPSALDPFGGAVTGIVGVNRDAMGFGLGAKPVINRYGFCFAPPESSSPLFRDAAKTQPLLSPSRIMNGVVAGVNNGGNCSGIPTTQGFLYFDERYKGKPLVFVGTVGLIPKKHGNVRLWEKQAHPGDYIVMVGGKVGIDGIHGATFSSEALSSGSPATAVQIGDPITQKKLSDALIKEARDLELYTSITDNGAGGLSCSVAEMAKECGGCRVILDQVPLKYPGLDPWQIWISESQERMTVSVPKEKWPTFLSLMKRRGVEATVIGEFTDSGKCEVFYQGTQVVDIDMEFLHDGLPKHHYQTSQPHHALPKIPESSAPLAQEFLDLLGRLNIGSFERISQQYDHEVQGGAVLKPLQGVGRVNGDASVVRPRLSSKKSVVLSQALYPNYSELDPYRMAAAAVDTAIRNAIVAGAKRNHLAILDNFCWCSGRDPERLWQLKESVRALHDTAVSYQTPIISGKDSMFNDFRGYDETGNPVAISVLPTLLVSSIGVFPDAEQSVSIDVKVPGDMLYLLGETADELGGTEYASYLAQKNGISGYTGTVPSVDPTKNQLLYDRYEACVERGLIASGISVSRGGLSMALAKTAIAGQLGVMVTLAHIPGTVTDTKTALFSESQGRILVTVAPEHVAEFESLLTGVSYARLGHVTKHKSIVIQDALGQCVLDLPVGIARAAYKSTFGILYQAKPRAAIMTGYGINCEEETAFAFEKAGGETQSIHINDLIDGHAHLDEFEILAFPGGFSFGDDTGSGNAYAQKAKNHIWQELLDFVNGDHLVVGICNGFQILVNLGLLPALDGKYGEREVALLHNDSALYTARWVDLAIEGKSPWFAGIKTLSLPIAHGEGKLYASADILQKMNKKQLIAARYRKGDISSSSHLPPNPNGSLENIASLSDESGRIVGLMPHPERAIAFTQLPNWTLLKEQYKRTHQELPVSGPGLRIFQNAIHYFAY